MRNTARPIRLSRCLLIALGAVAAHFASPCRADTALLSSVSGTGSIRAGWWTQSRSLDARGDIATASVWVNGRLDLDTAGTIRADAWTGAQSRDNAQGDRNERLRELYWQKYIGDADIRIGRQLIIWGRADGINPTDNLTPRDYTLLTPDDSDQRFGVFAANVSYQIGEQSLQLVWQPRFTGDTISLPDLPQVEYRHLSPQRRGQWAFKLDHSGSRIDWSVSYLDGDNRVPDLSLAAVRLDGVDIGLMGHRQRVLGADAATTLGPYVLRAEVARTFVDLDTDDAAQNFFRKRPQTQFIVGGERNITEHYTVNVQYFAQKVYDFDDPDNLTDPVLRQIARQQAASSNQTDGFEQGMTFRMAWNLANYTWRVETSGIYILNSDARLWRGKLVHMLSDRWLVDVGFDHFSGPAYSIIGRLKDNSTAFAELRYGF